MKHSAKCIRRGVPAAATLFLLAALAGCRLLAAPFLMWGEAPTQEVPAAYPYLLDKRVCVVVWAEMNTLFEYPQVQLELSEFVRSELEAKVKGALVVPSRKVVEYQRRNPDWDTVHPTEIGSMFDADRVLMIELTQYGTREPDSPHLYRGRIAANIKVYDTAYPNSQPTWKTAIETAYPSDSVGEWGTDDRAIRRATMEAFAADVAGKFYDRKVKVQ